MRKADGKLRSKTREMIPEFHWVSVETGGTAGGVPDMEFCHEGVQGWIECKWSDGWAVDLEPTQVAWHMRRARAGGRSFVLIRRQHSGGPRKGPPVDAVYLFAGACADRLRASGLGRWRGVERDKDLLAYGAGGPARWPWLAIRAALLGRPSGGPTLTAG